VPKFDRMKPQPRITCGGMLRKHEDRFPREPQYGNEHTLRRVRRDTQVDLCPRPSGLLHGYRTMHWVTVPSRKP
jgi:hypothetical protein